MIALQSPDHVLEHLVGSWVHCSGVMMFGVAHDGMEIAADGRFYFLKADASGVLARQKGFDGGGTWLLTDNYANGPGVYQVNFDMVPGQNMAYPAFQSNPSAMRLSLVPAGMADYVAAEQ